MVHTAHNRKIFNLLFSMVLCVASLSPAIADDAATREFQKEALSLGKAIDNDNSGTYGRCQQLRQDVENLKGKPQRRFTARQIYEQECTDSTAQPGSGFPGDEPGSSSELSY